MYEEKKRIYEKINNIITWDFSESQRELHLLSKCIAFKQNLALLLA